MIKSILIILSIVFFYSCKNSTPKGIIRQKEMQQILWDIARADALSQQLVRVDSTKSIAGESIKLNKEIFKIHNITEEQFKKSYDYYTRHPDIMRAMLDSINAEQTRKSTLEMQAKFKRIGKDSA